MGKLHRVKLLNCVSPIDSFLRPTFGEIGLRILKRRFTVDRDDTRACRNAGSREYIFAFPAPTYARRKGWRDAMGDAGGQKHALPKSTDFEDPP